MATVGISNGMVTGVAPGETTVTVVAKETPATSTSSRANRTAKVKITVVAPEDKPADAGTSAAAGFTFVDTKLDMPERILLNEGEEYSLPKHIQAEAAAANGDLYPALPDDEVLEQSDDWTVTALKPGYSTLFLYRRFARDDAAKTCYHSTCAMIPVTVLPAGEDKEDWLRDHMEEEAPYNTASVLSEGNVLVLCILAAAGAAGIVGAVLYGKRGKRTKDK